MTAHFTAVQLEGMTRNELEQLFATSASPPAEDLLGEHDGRVLGGSGFPVNNRVLRELIQSPWMPWRGKSFTRTSDGRIAGRNRVRVLGTSTTALDFRVDQEPSGAGDQPQCMLRYDVPGNPGIVTTVKDELKRVGEGLMLGKGTVDWRGQSRFELFFTLQRLAPATGVRPEIQYLTGARKALAEVRMGSSLLRRNHQLLPELLRSGRRILGDGRLNYFRHSKFVAFDGRVYVDCFAPGWPGKPFDHLTDHLVQLLAGRSPKDARFLPSLVISITKKCPYRCEHCYAIESLGSRDTVSVEQMLGVVRQMQRRGLGVIAWEGGEPLLRFDDLVTMIHATYPESEAWLATTGWGLTQEKAARLKDAGLSAAIISIDHYDPDEHNRFRRNKKAFDMAVKGVRLFRENGILPSICICATRDNIRDDSLYRYLELAKEIGVGFIQILDATPSGNYLGQNVMLSGAELETLKRFHVEVNTSARYRDYPAISARALIEDDAHFGCCACNGLCYIDSAGNLQACDLLQISFGNVFEEGFEPVYKRMQEQFPDFTKGRCPAQSLYRHIARAHQEVGSLPLPHSNCDAVLSKLQDRPYISESRT